MIGGMVRKAQAAARAPNTDSSAAAVAAPAANMHPLGSATDSLLTQVIKVTSPFPSLPTSLSHHAVSGKRDVSSKLCPLTDVCV